MPVRLVIHLPHRVLRVPLESEETVLGSSDDCDAVVFHPTVSRRHARLRAESRDGVEGARLEDLGSSNGTRVDGRRIEGEVRIEPGAKLAFGTVEAGLETVRQGDLQPAVALPSLDAEGSPTPRPGPAELGRTTLSSSALEEFTLGTLPRLLRRIRQGENAPNLARELGAALFQGFPCLEVEILHGRPGRRAVWFTARSDHAEGDRGAPVELEESELRLAVTFFPPSLGRLYAPVVEIGLQLLASADRAPVVRKAPPGAAPPLPAPTTVDPAVRALYDQATSIAPGDVGVLIQGESGTGKEVLARYLHAASGRPEDSFVALNCAALPRDLLELELFGIESGVATGVDARPGKFELADGGTLFLDEIGDMAMETQAKILRVLQEGSVYRLGGKQLRSARVRVLAATNRDVESRVSRGQFRNDLYHRIAGWVVELPPLRRRAGDIPNLAAHFLAEEAVRRGVRIAGISRSALDALVAWHWPGNIRELQREIARAALFLRDGELLESSHLRAVVRGGLDERRPTLKEVVDRAERQEIERVLTLTGNDTTAAAELLDIGRSTLYRRMKALGIQEREDEA